MPVARNSPLAIARFDAYALGQHGVCGSLRSHKLPLRATSHTPIPLYEMTFEVVEKC